MITAEKKIISHPLPPLFLFLPLCEKFQQNISNEDGYQFHHGNYSNRREGGEEIEEGEQISQKETKRKRENKREGRKQIRKERMRRKRNGGVRRGKRMSRKIKGENERAEKNNEEGDE